MVIKRIYEEQIRRLPLRDRLRLVQRIIAEAAEEGAQEGTGHRSLLELEGLGADLWEGIDAQHYVDELRDEWRKRP